MNFKAENDVEVDVSRFGLISWYKNDMHEREKGPDQIFTSGDMIWSKDDLIHREDGPAIICAKGNKRFYLNGVEYEEKLYWEKINEIQSHK